MSHSCSLNNGYQNLGSGIALSSLFVFKVVYMAFLATGAIPLTLQACVLILFFFFFLFLSLLLSLLIVLGSNLSVIPIL